MRRRALVGLVFGCGEALSLNGKRPAVGRLMGAPWEQLQPTSVCEEEMCLVPLSEEDMAAAQESMLAETALFDTALRVLPFASPLAAFASYETIAKTTRVALDFLGQRQTWTSADGNAYEIAILTPTINGVVMPAISIALGTLATTTISTLRQRQLDVRERLNRELGEIELLRATIGALDDADFRARRNQTKRATILLRDYVSRVIQECRPNAGVVSRRIADSELNAIYRMFFDVKDTVQRSNPAAATAHPLITSLVNNRASRLTLLAQSYPASQFIVLACGSLSIMIAFLLESDQEILKFLDAFQLRILFSMLVGVFSGFVAVLVDLADITRGTFRITPQAAQFFALRDLITFDLCCLDDDGPYAADQLGARPGDDWADLYVTTTPVFSAAPNNKKGPPPSTKKSSQLAPNSSSSLLDVPVHFRS
ncbi:hypothetical protein CTAYLR_006810 [Chrysophaeum taylorii]|uniref:Uncharacterized protein n=1 Tax=Chrysophaeum taylorii TaxID=2483200 RepID=A0AAD7UDX6_9STRA|nr:hypothetical protein CTAYLR_006810 [Chrysophaeum taylorii]